jgi:hypothetical protein
MNRKQVCQQTEGFGLFDYEVWSGTQDIILGCSSALQLIVAYSIFMKKGQAAHPAPIVGCIALCEGFFAYMGLTRYLICNDGRSNGVEVIFASTVLFKPNELDRAFEILAAFY